LPIDINMGYNIGILNDKGVSAMNNNVNVNEILNVSAINNAIETAYNSGVMTTPSGVVLWDGLASMVYNEFAPSGSVMNKLGEVTNYDNLEEIAEVAAKLYPLVDTLVDGFRDYVE